MAGIHSSPGPLVAKDSSSGDEVVFWCAAITLGCGAVASASATFGCANSVLTLFAPEISWILLAPSLLAVLLGSVGLCASRRPAANSGLLRLQLAVFVLVNAVILAGAGFFVFISSDASAQYISDGCDGHHATGLWTQAMRVQETMQMVNDQYLQLRCALVDCRARNPLFFDLAACSTRARCPGHGPVLEVPLYDWVQHLQLTFGCGGFCEDEVAIFGPSSMRETLPTSPACAGKIADSVHSLGLILGCVAGLIAFPLAAGAFTLFWKAAAQGGDDVFELSDSDADGNELQGQKVHLTGTVDYQRWGGAE